MHQYFIYCRRSTEDDDHQVISLESQRIELLRFGAARGLHIKEVLSESRSARLPGRPVFNQMMARIRAGEANGIIAWHPDRLARNSVDGGQIIHFLETERLLDLQFPTYVFEGGPQGKFMLAIVFGHSKYQVDVLCESVRRGNRTKREMGWLPGRPPIGYMNGRSDSGVKIIVKDPDRFPLVKRLWEPFLTGQHSVLELSQAAAKEMHLMTRSTYRRGARPVTVRTLSYIFRTPFYTGFIVFEGLRHQGKHEPMITLEDFNRAQTLLRRRRRGYVRKHFAFSKLIRCASCDGMITAEEHRKVSGQRYVYYHCTRRTAAGKCPEPWVQERELEDQIRKALADRVRPGAPSQQLREFIIAKALSVTLRGGTLSVAFDHPNATTVASLP